MANHSGDTFTFKKGHNEFLDQSGWKPDQIPNFDPVHPSMVIHDILEHEPGTEAVPHEEFKALGAMMWLRYEGGYFARKGVDLVPAMSNAVGMLYWHSLVKAKRETKEATGFKVSQLPLEVVGTEMNMVALIAGARAKIRQDYRFERVYEAIDKSLVHMLPWMRVGYRNAKDRFPNLDRGRFVKMYLGAEAEATEAIKRATEESVLTITCYPEQYRVEVGHNLALRY